MLSEIMSDAFVDSGKPRGAIPLNEGLNLVVGSERAKNSIGKTTFLLAIDFALGGSTYAKGPGDMFKNISHHEIRFAHRFGDDVYRFARHTADPETVWRCDGHYDKVRSMSVDEYTEWLSARYGLSELGGSFRSLQSPFFRIYGTKRDDPDRPLWANPGDTFVKELRRLVELFGRYGEIARLEEEKDELDKDKKAFREAKSRRYLRPARDRDDYALNEQKVATLEKQMKRILTESDTGATDIETAKDDYSEHLKATLKEYKRRRKILQRKLSAIEKDLGCISYEVDESYKALEDFFPGIDLAPIEKIESFHSSITEILRQTHEEEAMETSDELAQVDGLIDEIEAKLAELGAMGSLSSIVIEQYADLKSLRDELNKANELYDHERGFRTKTTDLNNRRNAEWEIQLKEIGSALNQEMERLNREAIDTQITSPTISFNAAKSYRFTVPNDGGTGSRYRGLFIFDMAMLNLTPLKFVIHDSPGLKQIEDGHTLGIFRLYEESGKQVFAAIDKIESYTETGEVPDVIADNTVLSLSSGHELFGIAWNRSTPEERSEGD